MLGCNPLHLPSFAMLLQKLIWKNLYHGYQPAENFEVCQLVTMYTLKMQILPAG